MGEPIHTAGQNENCGFECGQGESKRKRGREEAVEVMGLGGERMKRGRRKE